MSMEFRDKKYVALLQGREMLVGWHSRNIILGIYCFRIAALAPYMWQMGSMAEFNCGGLSSCHRKAEHTLAYHFWYCEFSVKE